MHCDTPQPQPSASGKQIYSWPIIEQTTAKYHLRRQKRRDFSSHKHRPRNSKSPRINMSVKLRRQFRRISNSTRCVSYVQWTITSQIWPVNKILPAVSLHTAEVTEFNKSLKPFLRKIQVS